MGCGSSTQNRLLSGDPVRISPGGRPPGIPLAWYASDDFIPMETPPPLRPLDNKLDDEFIPPPPYTERAQDGHVTLMKSPMAHRQWESLSQPGEEGGDVLGFSSGLLSDPGTMEFVSEPARNEAVSIVANNETIMMNSIRDETEEESGTVEERPHPSWHGRALRRTQSLPISPRYPPLPYSRHPSQEPWMYRGYPSGLHPLSLPPVSLDAHLHPQTELVSRLYLPVPLPPVKRKRKHKRKSRRRSSHHDDTERNSLDVAMHTEISEYPPEATPPHTLTETTPPHPLTETTPLYPLIETTPPHTLTETTPLYPLIETTPPHTLTETTPLRPLTEQIQ